MSTKFIVGALIASLVVKAHQLHLDGRKLPQDFIYGCATSAYQIEGAYNEDGKGKSIWDTFVERKGTIKGGDTGKVAMDFYHTYRNDLPLFQKVTGINTFDHTIAWTRILPNGQGKSPNPAGISFYREVAQAAHQSGMAFSATLYHWDLPQALQDEYGGWTSARILDDFENYARITMTVLGDVVDRWLSMNEPRTFCSEGYAADPLSAPGLNGNLTTLYECFHHALLAHARAHKVFRELKAQGKVKGTFGLKIDGSAAKPYDPKSEKDKAAALRDMDFAGVGWALGPLTTGEYPLVMRQTMGDLLPRFSKSEAALIKDSFDLVYFDLYTSSYAKHVDNCTRSHETWPVCVEETSKRNGKPIGKPTGSVWNLLANDTIYETLRLVQDRWKVKAVSIGENGMAVKDGRKQNLRQKLEDHDRVEWYRNSLAQISRILHEGDIPLKGFVFWSCISNFEWSNGYDEDFGVIYSSHGKNRSRSVKNSARYLKDVFVNSLPSSSTKWG